MSPSLEGIPTEANNAEKQLHDFRDEIRHIMSQEQKGGTSSHLISDSFNPDDLTTEDMAIWERIKSGAVTEEEIRAYQNSVTANVDKPKPGELPSGSRALFSGFISNLAGGIIIHRELEEKKRNHQS